MDQQVVELAKQVLESGFDRFSDRERRVLVAVAARLHVTQDVNRAVEDKQTFGDRWLTGSLFSADHGRSS